MYRRDRVRKVKYSIRVAGEENFKKRKPRFQPADGPVTTTKNETICIEIVELEDEGATKEPLLMIDADDLIALSDEEMSDEDENLTDCTAVEQVMKITRQKHVVVSDVLTLCPALKTMIGVNVFLSLYFYLNKFKFLIQFKDEIAKVMAKNYSNLKFDYDQCFSTFVLNGKMVYKRLSVKFKNLKKYDQSSGMFITH